MSIFKTKIDRITELPITADSMPMCSAYHYMDLAADGYEEKEFQFDGRANVYKTETDGSVGIRCADAPYTNRFLVRRPVKPENFSGNVIIEIVNATSFMDLDRIWIQTSRQLLRNGDIYVGITSKPNTLAKTKEYDPVRYAALQWPNPTPDEPLPFTVEEAMSTGHCLPDIDPEYEPGLFWDMLTDLAVLLRSDDPENPIRDYQPKYIALSGWSQSGCYLIKYLKAFHQTAVSVFDGFLIAGPPRYLPIPVSQYEVVSCARSENTIVKEVSRPCIILQTESENSALGAFGLPLHDGDSPDFMCRHYHITGASHDTKYTLIDYYKDDPERKRIHMLMNYAGKNELPNNYPTEILMAGAVRNLFRWISTGTAPAPCTPIITDDQGHNLKDMYGNTIGGLRTCLLDLPCGSFYATSDIEPGQSAIMPDSNQDPLFGHEEAFSKEMLVKLYGTLKHYKELCIAHTKLQVLRGYIAEEDMDTLVEAATERARIRGLE